MAREIKYRGKSLDNREWLYGYLMPSTKPQIHPNAKYSISVSTEILHSIDRYIYEVETETIGQFIGLKDCKGKYIYEGDIVRSEKYNDIKHIVLYDEKSASFCAVCIDANMGTELETRCHITQEWIDKYPKSIIGNIYDNPELLKIK